jgi:hypothetical protein
MKIGYIVAVGIFAMELAAVSKNESTECDTAMYCQDCVGKLGKDGEYNYLKSYPIKFESKEKVEFSYVLTKGTSYFITLCSDASMQFTLQDGARNTVVTNKVKDQVINAIEFKCGATGIYYLKYEPSTGKEACGGSALGFKR